MNSRRISVAESYSTYPNKDVKDSLYVTRSQYVTIIQSFAEKLAYLLITTGKIFKLPSRLGTLQVVKYKVEKKLVDYKLTRELYGEYNKTNEVKKVVYHTNRITKGLLPRLYWSKKKANFRNKTKYLFKFTRPNIRANKYNKNNPRVSMIDFFREKGFRSYDFFNVNI